MKDTTTYCIRCGKMLYENEAHYSKDDPDHEEPMCRGCCERYEKTDRK